MDLTNNSLIFDVATVAIVLHEQLRSTDEKLWPAEYYYHMFDGFPGWYEFCGMAGTVFHEEYQKLNEQHGSDEPEFYGAVDRFSETTIKKLLEEEFPFGKQELHRLACEASLSSFRYETGY